jgi:hypothetical protein
MSGVVMVVMALVVAALIYTLIRLGRNDYSALSNRMADRERDRLEVMRPCPICSTLLRKGQTVHSIVFSEGKRGSAEDSIAHLFGCPYCYPSNSDHPRICPVCGKTVSADGYIIARMFEKPGKKHVHVLGCTECRRKP